MALSCSKLICQNGTMELSQACGHEGDCHSDRKGPLGKSAFCINETFSREENPVVVQGALRRCGPGGQIGNDCGKLIKEGWHVCDPGCTQIVSPITAA